MDPLPARSLLTESLLRGMRPARNVKKAWGENKKIAECT